MVREAAARYLYIRPSDFLEVCSRDRRGGWTSARVARADVEYFGHGASMAFGAAAQGQHQLPNSSKFRTDGASGCQGDSVS